MINWAILSSSVGASAGTGVAAGREPGVTTGLAEGSAAGPQPLLTARLRAPNPPRIKSVRRDQNPVRNKRVFTILFTVPATWPPKSAHACGNFVDKDVLVVGIEAPLPGTPNPSSVGTPSAPVKLPSLPPPVPPSCKSRPSRVPISRTRSNRGAVAERSNAGRFQPPAMFTWAPGSTLAGRAWPGRRASLLRLLQARTSTPGNTARRDDVGSRAPLDGIHTYRCPQRSIGQLCDSQHLMDRFPKWR